MLPFGLSSVTAVFDASFNRMQREKLLITLGHDEGPAMVNIKVWNLEGQPKSSTASPPCLKTLRVFAPKQPEADITALAVHEESWPHMTLAIGLANGSVYCMRGDVGAAVWLACQRLYQSVRLDTKSF